MSTAKPVTTAQRPPCRVLGRADSSATESSYSHSSYSSNQHAQKSDSYSSALTTPDPSNQTSPLELKQHPPFDSAIPPQDIVEQILELEGPAQAEDAPGSKKFEFLGVSKLVRWMSTKGSTKPRNQSQSAEAPEPMTQPPRVSGDRERPSTLRRRSTSSRFSSITAKRDPSAVTSGASVPPVPTTAGTKLTRGLTLLQALHSAPNPGNAPTQSQPATAAVAASADKHGGEAIFTDRAPAAPDYQEVDATATSDASASLGSDTIRPDGTPGGSQDVLAAGSTADTAVTELPEAEARSGAERVHARKERRRRGLSDFRQSPEDLGEGAPGFSWYVVDPPTEVTPSTVQSEDEFLGQLSPQSTTFSHPQGLTSVPEAREDPQTQTPSGPMTYSEGGHAHADNHPNVCSLHTHEDLRSFSSDGHSSSLHTTLVSHQPLYYQTRSDIGHGGGESSTSQAFSSFGVRRSKTQHQLPTRSKSARLPARRSSMTRSGSLKRAGSGSTRTRSSGSLKRKKSSGGGVALKDRLKRGLIVRGGGWNWSVPSLSDGSGLGRLFSKSRVDLLTPASEEPPLPPPKTETPPPPPSPKMNRRRSTLVKKRPSVIPEDFHPASFILTPPPSDETAGTRFSPSPISPNPATDALPDTPMSQEFSELHGTPRNSSTSHSHGRASSRAGSQQEAHPTASERLRTIGLPVEEASSLGRRSTEKKKLSKKRGGSLGSAVDLPSTLESEIDRPKTSSNSFMSNLSGALSGLGSRPSSSRSKLSKSRPQPPPAWSSSSNATSFKARSASTYDLAPTTTSSPLSMFIPSPDIHASNFTASPLSETGRSSSGIFSSKSIKRSSLGPRPESGIGSSSTGGEKLRKRRSKNFGPESGAKFEETPPVPPLPPLIARPYSQPRPTTAGLAVDVLPVRSASQPPPPLTPLGSESSYKRAPLTSLAYTGKQGYHSRAGSRHPSEVDLPLSGRRPTESQISFFAARPEDAGPSTPVRPHQANYVGLAAIPSPNLMVDIATDLILTSPSAPATGLGDERRGASLYESLYAESTSTTHLIALSKPVRPPLPHRPTSNSAKRWTIAVNHIQDDGDFLREIDDLRKSRAKLSTYGGSSRTPSYANLSEAVAREEGLDGKPLAEDPGLDDGGSDEEEGVWMKARRAMLCVREIMRTESSYRGHLQTLYDVETIKSVSTAPEALLSHLPRLISASAALSCRLEEDPSAWGVSSAFLGVEDELEQVFVSWCAVVGQVMMELASAGPTPSSASSRTSNPYRKFSGTTGSKDKDTEKDKAPKRSDTAGSTGSSGTSTKPTKATRPTKSRPNSAGSTSGGHFPLFGSKPLAIQDVAIMPSQRIPRYVLLFRDLLHQTPITSPSRALVERALEGAIRIARSCDEAQQHNSLLASSNA